MLQECYRDIVWEERFAIKRGLFGFPKNSGEKGLKEVELG